MARFGFRTNVEVQGAREVIRLLKKIPVELRRNTLRRALLAAGGVFKRGAKRRTPERTGLLARSWRVKSVRVSKASDVMAFRVAPKSTKRAIRRTAAGKLRAISKKKTAEMQNAGAKMRYANPANYGHLVELGHKTPGGGRVEGKHFLRKAFDGRKRAAYRQAVRQITKAIEKFRSRRAR